MSIPDLNDIQTSLPGCLVRTDAVYAVSNLSSLFTVCALAVKGSDEYCEDIRERVLDDVTEVLQWGALLAEDIASQVAEQIERARTVAGKPSKGGTEG
jgi:hypothetical protein